MNSYFQNPSPLFTPFRIPLMYSVRSAPGSKISYMAILFLLLPESDFSPWVWMAPQTARGIATYPETPQWVLLAWSNWVLITLKLLKQNTTRSGMEEQNGKLTYRKSPLYCPHPPLPKTKKTPKQKPSWTIRKPTQDTIQFNSPSVFT